MNGKSTTIMETIVKGSLQWDTLFRGIDPEKVFTESYPKFDRLHAEGDLSALLDPSRPKVLIAGSRDLTLMEQTVIPVVMAHLAKNPAKPVIISGFAVGNDTIVHTTALSSGLATVAVLPTGLDTIYPACNKDLARKMASTPWCALLTQFPEGTEPKVTNFLARNNTAALLSDLMIITFSKEKGGAMLTATMMNLLERPVYALPGRLNDEHSRGSNRLIASGKATLLDNVNLKMLEILTVKR